MGSTLSSNPNITWDIVRDNLDKPWDWDSLSYNPTITLDIKENPEKPWDWYSLSRHPTITWDIVKENPKKPWNWEGLSSNPNITWDVVKDNLHKPWNWFSLSSNPNITWDIIKENPDKPWCWNKLLRTNFSKQREQFLSQQYIKHIAAFKIQTYWRKANYDPSYELCKRRLIRECDELGINE